MLIYSDQTSESLSRHGQELDKRETGGERTCKLLQRWRLCLQHPYWLLLLAESAELRSHSGFGALSVQLCLTLDGFSAWRGLPTWRPQQSLRDTGSKVKSPWKYSVQAGPATEKCPVWSVSSPAAQKARLR